MKTKNEWEMARCSQTPTVSLLNGINVRLMIMRASLVRFLIVFKVIIFHPLFFSGIKLNFLHCRLQCEHLHFWNIQNQVNVITISLCVIALVPALKMETIWLSLSLSNKVLLNLFFTPACSTTKYTPCPWLLNYFYHHVSLLPFFKRVPILCI